MSDFSSLKNKGNHIARFAENGIIHTNVFIALGALCWTYSAEIISTPVHALNPYYFTVFFGTVLVYNLPYINYPREKNEWVLTKRLFQPSKQSWLVWLPAMGVLMSFLWLDRKTILALLPLGGVVFLYYLSIWRKLGFKSGLREVPYVKLFLIAGVWAVATSVVPVINSIGKTDSLELVFMVLRRFLFIIAITIPFDIRDWEEDKAAGLKTIPQAFNETQSMFFAKLSLVLFGLITLVEFFINHNYSKAIALLLGALYVSGLLNSTKLKQHRLYFYFFLDGAILVHGLLLIAFCS